MIEDLLEHISNGWTQKTTGRRFSEEEVAKLKHAIDNRKQIESELGKINLDKYFNYCIKAKMFTT